MEKEPFENIWDETWNALVRVANQVAKLTTGQFILLCVLGLIGASVLGSILGLRHGILPQLAFFLIVVLLAVRITTRTQNRAEERVTSAESSAEMESLRRQVTEAQLQTLQAQVEPHFLFNTLAAVEHLTETDPPRATAMLQHLIAFLRGSLPNMRGQTTSLGREVDLCKSYLAIMQIRMEDRLTVSIDVPEALRGLSFPPMMLQSLVENAIKHGLEPKPEGGAIALSARRQDGRLRVTVADTGLGVAENAPPGIGLSNIRDRLKRLYDGSAALILAPNAPTGAHITIEIPYVPSPESDTGR
ncbi:MAG: sensor histidine kinase [Proteobacteria bacterium]|nr:sensor histidine kinase [Pseudomonadota bacterium]